MPHQLFPSHRYGCQTAPLLNPRHRGFSQGHSLQRMTPAATFKWVFGFHPLFVFVDHGADGTGDPLQIALRPGNAGSNTAQDHIDVVKADLKQLRANQPRGRPGRKVLVR